MLETAQAADAAEDARYGREASGDELPAALRREVDFRQARRARMREAKAALEARAVAEAAAHQRNRSRGQAVCTGRVGNRL
jgi:hypothetical protein